jgi:hypothetical protein
MVEVLVLSYPLTVWERWSGPKEVIWRFYAMVHRVVIPGSAMLDIIVCEVNEMHRMGVRDGWLWLNL